MTKYTTGFFQAIEGAGILAAIVLLFMTFESRAATLNWIGHGGDGFNIYCADQNSQQYTKVATTTATTAAVTECAVKSQWYVTAFNSVGESDPSNIGYLDLSLPGTPVLTTSACPVCETVPPPIVEVWLTQTNGTYTTRPVYSEVGFPEVRTKIGEVGIKVPCGDFVAPYSATSKTLSWRKVQAGDVASGPVIGVTLCKKQ